MRQPKRTTTKARTPEPPKPIERGVETGPDWRIDYDPNTRDHFAYSTLGGEDNLLGCDRFAFQARQRISDYLMAGAR